MKSIIIEREKRISIKQYNFEIETAMKEIKLGKGVTHSGVVKQSKKWLKERKSYFDQK